MRANDSEGRLAFTCIVGRRGYEKNGAARDIFERVFSHWHRSISDCTLETAG
jgi:hypothetical protein